VQLLLAGLMLLADVGCRTLGCMAAATEKIVCLAGNRGSVNWTKDTDLQRRSAAQKHMQDQMRVQDDL